MKFEKQVNAFIKSLRQAPETPVFNPWYDVDGAHDVSSKSPAIRTAQLRQYLTERQHAARLLLIAEALGYQGGHFTGIAMTSERILLGHKASAGVQPADVIRGLSPHRTSKPEVKTRGFSENTATIVWKAFFEMDVDPYSVVLWNGFPWHPYEPTEGLLSNRTPTRDELEFARPFLEQFLMLYPKTQIVAVGNHTETSLNALDISCVKLRHPAFGGATKFRRGLKSLTDG